MYLSLVLHLIFWTSVIIVGVWLARRAGPPKEQAVIVNFRYGSEDLDPLFALENRLVEAIEQAGAGEFDGNEVAADGSDGSLFMYGPSADKLYAAIKSVLSSADFMEGAQVILRYGPADSKARESTITFRREAT